MSFKRYHIIIASLFFAFMMWGSVTLGDEYYISLDMPLVVHDIPQSKALRGSLPNTVSVRLRGTGWRILSMLFSGTPQCILNVSGFSSQPVAIYKSQLLNSIPFTAGLQPVDINLDTLVLSLDNYIERKLFVRPDVVVDSPEGYGVVGQIRVMPESVVIGGAESVLRKVEYWKTEPTVFSKVREPFVVQVPLASAGSYAFHIPQRTVQVSVNVQPFAEKTLSGLAIEARYLPPNRDIIFIPPKIDIIVRGGIEQLASLSGNDVRLSVDYRELLSDTTGYVQPVVESPSGIRVLAKRPDRLQYIIRKRL
jgi:hypothetical protein